MKSADAVEVYKAATAAGRWVILDCVSLRLASWPSKADADGDPHYRMAKIHRLSRRQLRRLLESGLKLQIV